MQSCMHLSTKPRPDIKRWCSIKVIDYRILMRPGETNRDKGIIMILDFEVVKTAEVRD